MYAKFQHMSWSCHWAVGADPVECQAHSVLSRPTLGMMVVCTYRYTSYYCIERSLHTKKVWPMVHPRHWWLLRLPWAFELKKYVMGERQCRASTTFLGNSNRKYSMFEVLVYLFWYLSVARLSQNTCTTSQTLPGHILGHIWPWDHVSHTLPYPYITLSRLSTD